jgi:hypothetical protein
VFRKKLSSNDVGATETKQAGVLVPKSDARGGFFPQLGSGIKNPDSELLLEDERGTNISVRFVYYNNKFFDSDGTRDEYRITHIMGYLQSIGAKEGDYLEIFKGEDGAGYRVKVIQGSDENFDYERTETPEPEEQDIIQYQITNYPADMTISGYLEKHKQDQLIIPDFQRNYVWDQVKASKLIESFLLGLPVPGVFLYKDRRSNKLLIIDGQQRITSAIQFLKGAFGEKVFRLKGVHSRWEGKTFEELDQNDKFQINDTVLRATIIQQLDPQDDSSIYYIFERLNTGGINLNPMEVRRCVYYGDFIKKLEVLNGYPSWRKILGAPEPDKRMRDIELLLRCLAFFQAGDTYEKPMKGFLNKFILGMKNLVGPELNQKLEKLASVFESTCDIIVEELGEKPFNVYGRLNFALLDSVFVAVAKTAARENLSEKFSRLLSIDDYETMCRISTSDEKIVRGRMDLALSQIGGN